MDDSELENLLNLGANNNNNNNNNAARQGNGQEQEQNRENNEINNLDDQEHYFEELKKQLRKVERNDRRGVLADEESAFGSFRVEVATCFFKTLLINNNNINQNKTKSNSSFDFFCTLPESIRNRLAPFQRDGVNFLFQHLFASKFSSQQEQNADSSGGCCIFDPMGLGKTVQVCAFFGAWVKNRCNLLASNANNNNGNNAQRIPFESFFKSALVGNSNNNNQQQQQPLRCLIVCPSTLISIWVEALQQWAGVSFNCIEVITKAKSQRIQQWKQTAKYLNKKYKQQQQPSTNNNINLRGNNKSTTIRSQSPTPIPGRIDVGTNQEMFVNFNSSITARSVSPVPVPMISNIQNPISTISPLPNLTTTMMMMNNNNNNTNNFNEDDDANQNEDDERNNNNNGNSSDLVLPIFTEVLPQKSCLFFICTYGVMKNDVEDILNDLPAFDCCVLDEAQMIKDASTDVFKGAVNVKANFRIAVSGTPLSNHFGDIWSVMQFVDPTVIPMNRAEFSKVNSVLMKGNERNISEAEEARAKMALADLRVRLEQYMIRREKRDVADQCAALGVQIQKENNNNNNNNQDDDEYYNEVESEDENDDHNNNMMMMMPARRQQQQQRSNLNKNPNQPSSSASVKKQQPAFPEKVDAVIWCKLSPEQEALYRQFLSCDEVTQALNPGSTKSPLVLLTCLIKICDHPWLSFSAARFKEALKNPLAAPVEGHPEAGESALCSSKIQALLAITRLAKNDSEKLLVFSRSKRFHDIVAAVFLKAGIDFCRLDGDTPAADRANLVRRINAYPGSLVCLATTQVGGVGLTFNGISRVVLADPSWNPAVDAQAVDRVHRVGQLAKKVTIIRLITCGTVEEKMYRNQLHKMIAAFQALGTDPQQLLRYFSHTQLRDMFSLSRTDKSETNQALRAVHVMLYQSGLAVSSSKNEIDDDDLNIDSNHRNHLPDYPGKDVRDVFDRLKSLTNSVVDVSDHDSVLKVSAEARKNLEHMLTTSSSPVSKSENGSSENSMMMMNMMLPPPDNENNIVIPPTTTTRRRQRAKDASGQSDVATKKNTAISRQQPAKNQILKNDAETKILSDSQQQNGTHEEEEEIDIMEQILLASQPENPSQKPRERLVSFNTEQDEDDDSSQFSARNDKKIDEDNNEDEDSSLFVAPPSISNHNDNNNIATKQRLSAQLEQNRKSDHAFRQSIAEKMWNLLHHTGSNNINSQQVPLDQDSASKNNNNNVNNENHPPALSQPIKMINNNTISPALTSSSNHNFSEPKARASVAFHNFSLLPGCGEGGNAEPRKCQKNKNVLLDDDEDDEEVENEDGRSQVTAFQKYWTTNDSENNNSNQNLEDKADGNQEQQLQDEDDEYEDDERESELLEYFLLDSNLNNSNNGNVSLSQQQQQHLPQQNSRFTMMKNNNRFSFMKIRTSNLRGTLEARDSDFALFDDEEGGENEQAAQED